MIRINRIEYTIEGTGKINRVEISFVGTTNRIIMLPVSKDIIQVKERKDAASNIRIDKSYTIPARFMLYGTIYDILDKSGFNVIYTKESICPEISKHEDYYKYTTTIKEKDISIRVSNECDLLYFKNAGRYEIREHDSKKIIQTYNVCDTGILIRDYLTTGINCGKPYTNNWITFEGKTYYTKYGNMIENLPYSNANIKCKDIHYLNKQILDGADLYDYPNSEQIYPMFVDMINPDNSFNGNSYYILDRSVDTSTNTIVQSIEFIYNA